MRVPKIEHYKTGEKIQVVKYDAPASISRYPVITNERQKDKLIKTIERLVRSSLEYKDLIKFLKEFIDMNSCEFFQNFDGRKKKGSLEIHHEPFDLYTITDIVLAKQQREKGYIDELEIAEEVMRIHYLGLVGLVPLSITAHELVHDGKLAVPLNCVYGKFVEFVREYYTYIMEANPAYLTMLAEKIDLTKKLSREDLSVLTVRYIYTVVDGFKLPELVEGIA